MSLVKIYALGACHPECRFCALDWWRWLRDRENQMSVPRKKYGETISFAQAAATSIKAD